MEEDERFSNGWLRVAEDRKVKGARRDDEGLHSGIQGFVVSDRLSGWICVRQTATTVCEKVAVGLVWIERTFWKKK